MARTVAAGSSGKAEFLDAGAVWGGTYQRVNTTWLLTELAALFPRFLPGFTEGVGQHRLVRGQALQGL